MSRCKSNSRKAHRSPPISRRWLCGEPLERREVLDASPQAVLGFATSENSHFGSNWYDRPAVAHDAAGNTYISGGLKINDTCYPTSIDLDPANTSPDDPALLKIFSPGSSDPGHPCFQDDPTFILQNSLAFVAKYDADGTFQWVHPFLLGEADGPSTVSQVTQLKVGSSGSIYFGGESNGWSDRAVGELDSNGNLIWSKQLDLPAAIQYPASGLVIDELRSRLYIAGDEMPTNPGPGHNAVVAAVDFSNLDSVTVPWTARLERASGGVGMTESSANSIAIDSQGAVYAVGSFYGKWDFDPGPNTLTISSGGGQGRYADTPTAAFVWKLQADNGMLGWAKTFTGSGASAQAIAFDGANLMVAGGFSGTVDFDPNSGVANLTSAGGGDGFIAKLTTSGSLVFARRYGGTESETPTAMALDGAGNPHIAGGTHALPGFVAKFTGSGAFVGDQKFTSDTGGVRVTSLSVLPLNNTVQVAGHYLGKLFNSGNPVAILDTGDGTRDIFSLVYGPITAPPPPPGITVTPTSGLQTTEAGGTATFSVVLASPPTADVTIPISSIDTTEGSLTITNLLFTPLNWNTPQTVTIRGVDDTIRDGNIAYRIALSAATSADARYHNLNPADVSVTNIDNEKGKIQGSSQASSMQSFADTDAALLLMLADDSTISQTRKK